MAAKIPRWLAASSSEAGARGGGDADGDDLANAFLGGALEDGGNHTTQSPVIQVGVGIDEWSRAGALGRGIHGSEAVSGGGD